KLQHQPAVDQKAFDKQQKLLSTQIDTQKHLQQDYQKTAEALDGLRQQVTKADEDRSHLETTRTKLREKIASLTSKHQASLGATPQTSATAPSASAVGEGSYQEAKQQWQASR